MLPPKFVPKNIMLSKKDLALLTMCHKIGLIVHPTIFQHVWFVDDEKGKKKRKTKRLMRLHVTYNYEALYLTKKIDQHNLTEETMKAYRKFYRRVYDYKRIYIRRPLQGFYKIKEAPKVFVPGSYERSNAFGISVLENHLISKGNFVLPKKEEDYGVDVVSIKDGVTRLFEVETKTGYPFEDVNTFPFDTVSFLGRKKKWNKNGGFWYAIVCRETKAMVMCHSNIIYKEEYKQTLSINSAERQGNDVFYRVPKELCYWIESKELQL